MTLIYAAAERTTPAAFVEAQMLERNRLSRPFFEREADPLARACHDMAGRFARGGRLLAFGRRQYATDAQHVEVEFVHPVLVGKRALPALDISSSYAASLEAVLRPDDIVMLFGPPGGDMDLLPLLEHAAARGAQTLALPGSGAHYSLAPWQIDPFIHQELIEIVYHTLWETVHVFLEHHALGHDAGAAAFLYPFLGTGSTADNTLIADVAASIRAKAQETERLRAQVSKQHAQTVADAVLAIVERVRRGGRLLLFGNGGSATDADDWALDCVDSPKHEQSVPALSLARASAVISALANDVGTDELFLRQIIAHAEPEDVAIAISTSGGSRNVLSALEEARRRGLLTIALVGHRGGVVLRRAAADHIIVVHSDDIPRIQEVQASIYHVIRDLLHALQTGRISAPAPVA